MPYPIEGYLEINEDMVEILLMLKVLFTQDSEAWGLSLFKMIFSMTLLN